MAGNRDILAHEIVNRFISAISGTEEKQIIKYNPNDRIYVGKLSPQSSSDSFSSNVLIKQISVDFRIKQKDIAIAEIEIYPQGNFFYRVLPSFEQQRCFFLEDFVATFTESNIISFEDLIKNAESNELSEEMKHHRVALLPVYEKIAIDDCDRCLRVKLSEIYNEEFACGTTVENQNFQDDLDDFVKECNK